MPLTQLQIVHAKPSAAPYKLADGGSLYLLVKPNGTKTWRMNYRFGDRHRTLHVGRWPAVSLADARERRDSAHKLLSAGRDPVQEARLIKLAQQISAASTFKAIAEEWFEKNKAEGRAPVTLDKIRWLLELLYPTLGTRPIADITPQEVLFELRKLEATGRHESARRMRSVVSRVFRYAIATARAKHDVAADLRGATITPTVTHHAAIITRDGVGQLLRSIDGFSGHEVTTFALKLAPHLFVRPGELRAAEWEEFDAEESVWSLPAEKTKMRRPHWVPLSRQVKNLLFDLYELTGHGKYLFPSFLTPDRPMCENTLNTALRRMGYSQAEMTSHGFRATADTLLNEMREFHPDVIERQMAHLDKNSVRRIYFRGEYWDERVVMMQRWSDYLDELRALRPQAGHGFARPGTQQGGGEKATGFRRPAFEPSAPAPAFTSRSGRASS